MNLRTTSFVTLLVLAASGPALPAGTLNPGRYRHASFVHAGNLYVLGGVDMSGYLDTVELAPITSDGTLGAFVLSNPSPSPCMTTRAIAHNGWAYCLGGYYGAGCDTTWRAPIMLAGGVGEWWSGPPHGAPRCARGRHLVQWRHLRGGRLRQLRLDPGRPARAVPRPRRPRPLLQPHRPRQRSGRQLVLVHGNRRRSPSAVVPGGASIVPELGSHFNWRLTGPGSAAVGTCGRYVSFGVGMDDLLQAADGAALGNGTDVTEIVIDHAPLQGPGTSLRLTKQGGDVHLAWAATAGATSYNVRRCDAFSGPCSPFQIANTTATTYDDPVLLNTKIYWYQVDSVNGICVAP